MSPERIDIFERDLQSHAKTISEFTMALAAIKQDAAVRVVKDEYLDDRLDRMEKRIEAVYKLGIWVLTTFGASLIALIANFVFKGGLNLGP